MTDKQACTQCDVDGHAAPDSPTQPSSEAATKRHYPGCQAARRRVASGELSPMCATCNDNGRIGGPSFYAPDEGGEPCPDCAQPSPTPELELLRSALSHIIKTCNQSRTETRRLRWIAQRAQWALDGKRYDVSAFDLPKYSTTAKERLEREMKILREQVAQAGQVPQTWHDVQAERLRQIEAEGWTLESDDQSNPGELAHAAVAYLLFAFPRAAFDRTYAERFWPRLSGFNPKGVRRDLVRACALSLAALERVDRAASAAQRGSADDSRNY